MNVNIVFCVEDWRGMNVIYTFRDITTLSSGMQSITAISVMCTVSRFSEYFTYSFNKQFTWLDTRTLQDIYHISRWIIAGYCPLVPNGSKWHCPEPRGSALHHVVPYCTSWKHVTLSCTRWKHVAPSCSTWHTPQGHQRPRCCSGCCWRECDVEWGVMALGRRV